MFEVSGVDIDKDGVGDIVLVPGVPGKVIKVYRIMLTVAGGNPTITFKSGSTKLPGTFHMQDGGSIALGLERRRWAECEEGEDFVIHLSEQAKVGGALTVWIG